MPCCSFVLGVRCIITCHLIVGHALLSMVTHSAGPCVTSVAMSHIETVSQRCRVSLHTI